MNEMRKLMEALKRIDEDVVDFPGMNKEPEQGDRILEPGEEIPAGAKQIDLTSAFGSSAMNIIREVLPNRRFFEKPSYWEDLDKPKHTLTELELRTLQAGLARADITLPTYSAYDIFGNGKPQHPMANADLPQEDTFIVEMYDGTSYLCDGTGANTYIRMWMAIV